MVLDTKLNLVAIFRIKKLKIYNYFQKSQVKLEYKISET